MLLILLSLLILFVLWELYKRYSPVFGIHYKDALTVDTTNIEVIDVRDYNISYKDVIENSLNIPVAYLERYCYEIPEKQVHVVAATKLERNIAIRILKRNGFQVSGYTVSGDCLLTKQCE
ncbi:hypothetical protein [Ferdinandcohnia sp. Marseille-Q9671]